MWARHFEMMLGLWLGFSWLIFDYSSNDFMSLKINDGTCAVFIIFFSLISYMNSYRYCHLLNFSIGVWLITWVINNGTEVNFGPYQNYVVLGFLLIMLSLVPSRTKEPPKVWADFLSKKKN